MVNKVFKALKKLVSDRVFQKSILHFTLFAAVVFAFVQLTTHHIITRQPQPMLPYEYGVLAENTANVMSPVELERDLRSQSPDVQGLIFFKGVSTVVVLGNGLEHDRIVQSADTDEMRKLAAADKLPVTEKDSTINGELRDLLSGWWYVAAITLGCWFIRMLIYKREKGAVHSRLRVFCSGIPVVMTWLEKMSGQKTSRFYLYLFLALLVGNCAAFGLRLYHTDNLYVLPADVASAQAIQPWQVMRHLDDHPEEFQRVSIVKEMNTAYVVLNSASATNPKAKGDFSDDDDFTPTPVPAQTNAAGNPPVTIGGGTVPMIAMPAGRGGVHMVPAPQPPKSVPMTLVGKDGKKLTLVGRRVEFGTTAAGKVEFAAFIAGIDAKKIESKTAPAVHQQDYIDSLTFQGRVIMFLVLGLTIAIGVYTINCWGAWKEAENPRRPGEVSTPRPILSLGNLTGGGGDKLPVTREEDRKTFADVAGCQEAIDELRVVQKKIMRPRLYKVFGAPTPSGVILWGPPGTGKTLLARALAGEVGGSFQIASGSEFVEMYVGVGAKRIRELYATARAAAAKTGRISIVFIDEFDALAKKRGTSTEGGNREYEQTLNQLLVEMNGFGNHGMVLTMAATNRLDVLDEAVLRPGRFDVKVKVPKPDKKGRALIYGIYMKKLRLVLAGETEEEKAVAYQNLLDELARRSHDFSGAEIEGSIKDGATIAVERQFGDVLEDISEEMEKEFRNKAIITADDLNLGIDKMAYGTQIRSRVRTDKERMATAIHEIGHATVPTVENGDKVNRITIVMTDKSLGLMDSSPEEGERYDWTDEQFIIRLKMMLAGRAAEKVLLNKISTGASNDFERASQLARQMVGVYGMSEAFGNKSIPLDQHGFPASNIGETMMVKFNDAWCSLIDRMQAETEALITRHKAQIRYCAKRLYDDETLTGDEFRALFAQEAEALAEEKAETEDSKGTPNAQ